MQVKCMNMSAPVWTSLGAATANLQVISLFFKLKKKIIEAGTYVTGGLCQFSKIVKTLCWYSVELRGSCKYTRVLK